MSFKEQQTPKPLTVIERLRLQYRYQNILTVAVELDNPEDMRDFFFQYVDELKASPLEVVRERPFDTAARHITHVAAYSSPEAVSRWNELFTTGTLQEGVDHSFDWMNPQGEQGILKGVHDSYGDWMIEHRKLLKIAKDDLGIQNLPQVPARSAAAPKTSKKPKFSLRT